MTTSIDTAITMALVKSAAIAAAALATLLYLALVGTKKM
jgi:hypothetical protein